MRDRTVDIGGGADARVDERVGLAEECVLQPVGDEAAHVAADDDRRFPEGLRPRAEGVDCLGRGLRAADDFDDLGELRRAEPVEACEALRPFESRGKGVKWKRRGVRRQDRLRGRDLLGEREERALRLDRFLDRLDHKGRTRERVLRRDRELDRVTTESRPGGLEAACPAGAEPHRAAGLGEDARDPGAHRARADDGDFPRQLHAGRVGKTREGPPERALSFPALSDRYGLMLTIVEPISLAPLL